MPSLEVNNPYFTAAMEGVGSLEEKNKGVGGGKAFLYKKKTSIILNSLHELPYVRRRRERMKLSTGRVGLAVPPKTATSSSLSPCTPKSTPGRWDKVRALGGSQPHTLLPGCNTGPCEMKKMSTKKKKGNVKKWELKILHSALALRAEESVLAGKGGSGSEFGQGCGGQGTLAGVGFSPRLCSFPELPGQGRDLFCSQESP